ncbi:MAG TPA: peptidase MA family metallohydrolase [Dehalococcoidia bacterium]|nr:peptidase MA family metallohydrolase [Dehalococcoidia bacterium]
MATTSGSAVFFAAVALALALLAAPVRAQETPSIADGGATVEFPAGVTFTVSAESSVEITDIRLRYTVLPDGTAAIGQPEFDPSTSVEATFELAGNNPPQIYLSPGTRIEYHWEVSDAEGNQATSEIASVFYDDTRFDWQTVSGSNITIYYYSGSDHEAEAMHDVAREAVSSMSSLLDTEVEFETLIWIYDNTDDMRPALQARSETYESQVITAGVRVASDTVLVLGNDAFDTLRHELTHIVTAQAGESAFGTLPAWVDEGTAVYSQEDAGGFRSAIEDAIDRGEVFSVREISSYPGDPDKVNLFYGQSWSLVSYLIDEYGEEQFAQLFAEVKSGSRIESALEAVYGFGQDGLEDEWRAAKGLPPRPTNAPDGPDPQDDPQPLPSEDDGGSSTLLVIGLAVGVIALAAVVGIGGIWAARKAP